MATGSGLNQLSGTFNFNPTAGEAVLYAFARCGLRRSQLVQEHMLNARMAANLVLADWSNDQPNLWELQKTAVPLIPGQASYSVPGTVMVMLDAFLRTNPGGSDQFDFYMFPISRSEWASFPDKYTPGQPTVYWFDRLLEPTVTLWQPPSQANWEFHYYSVGQMQDVDLGNGTTIPIPVYFMKAFIDELAAQLAVIYAPDRLAMLRAEADMSKRKADARNTEDVPYFVVPGLSGYFNV